MQIENNDNLKQLHDAYCRLTGYYLRWDTGRAFWWRAFALQFTVADLETVIRFIKREKAHDRPARSMFFRSLIGGQDSLSFFEEDLQAAKAQARIPRHTPRDSALQAVGKPTARDVQAQAEPRPVAKVLPLASDKWTIEEWNEFFAHHKKLNGL